MSFSPDDALQNLVAKNGGLAGQSPGVGGKTIGQGAFAQNISEMNPPVMKSLTGIDPQALQALQTVDNSAKIGGQVGTMAPPVLQHSAGGFNKGGQAQGQ